MQRERRHVASIQRASSGRSWSFQRATRVLYSSVESWVRQTDHSMQRTMRDDYCIRHVRRALLVGPRPIKLGAARGDLASFCTPQKRARQPEFPGSALNRARRSSLSLLGAQSCWQRMDAHGSEDNYFQPDSRRDPNSRTMLISCSRSALTLLRRQRDTW